jgi:hypothetical protein
MSFAGTWSINWDSNTTFPFFQADDTVTIVTKPTASFTANASGSPSFSSVQHDPKSRTLTAAFSYNNTSYTLTVVHTKHDKGKKYKLQGSVYTVENPDGGVGGGTAAAVWTSEDGPDPEEGGGE